MSSIHEPIPEAANLTYFPEWLNQLRDDVVLRATALNGELQGADKLRAVIGFARTLYEFQDFRFTGRYDDGFIEEYAAQVGGHPINTVVIVHYDDEGKVESVTINHRPLTSMLHFSSKMREQFGDTFGPNRFYSGELPADS
ncbi:hypothetical protein PV350_29750 [Streptomyces sp. PA03-6a]|nr:hypothetical protein [Streptomyces sp. PA03-6a]